jgi:hypothetical protein
MDGRPRRHAQSGPGATIGSRRSTARPPNRLWEALRFLRPKPAWIVVPMPLLTASLLVSLSWAQDPQEPPSEVLVSIDWQAHPAWTEHRGFPTWCGDYDWDCDGSETKGLTTEGSCGLDLSICGADPAGWRYASSPSCGSYGDWVAGCDIRIWPLWDTGCDEVYITMYQTCL